MIVQKVQDIEEVPHQNQKQISTREPNHDPVNVLFPN